MISEVEAVKMSRCGKKKRKPSDLSRVFFSCFYFSRCSSLLSLFFLLFFLMYAFLFFCCHASQCYFFFFFNLKLRTFPSFFLK